MKIITTSFVFVASLVVGCSSSSTDGPANDGVVSSNPAADGEVLPNPGTDGTDGTDGDVVAPGVDLTANTVLVGFLDIEESPRFNSVEVSGFFFQLDDPVLQAEFDRDLPSFAQEQCTVTEIDILDFDDELPDFGPNTVSAGDVITLSGLTGSYGEMVAQTQFGLSGYVPVSSLPFPAPNPLFISIPGDVFPAFSEVEVAAAQELTGQNLTFGSSLTASTTSTWDVATVGGGDIILRADVETGRGTVVELDCLIDDDGSFTLPASTLSDLDTLLGGSGWSLQVYSHTRTTRVIQRSGNSVLLVYREVAGS